MYNKNLYDIKIIAEKFKESEGREISVNFEQIEPDKVHVTRNMNNSASNRRTAFKRFLGVSNLF